MMSPFATQEPDEYHVIWLLVDRACQGTTYESRLWSYFPTKAADVRRK